MPILSVWLINKSGGLIYQRDFHPACPKLGTNDFLVLAGTFQSVHAIATQCNPTSSTKCSGIESVEWYGYSKPPLEGEPLNENNNNNTVNTSNTSNTSNVASTAFKLNCFQSATGLKILLLSSPRQPQLDYILKRIYELYADYAMKNPFHTPEMPVRSDKFEGGLGRLVKQMSTNNYY